MPEAPEIYYLKELLKTKIKKSTLQNIISNTQSTVILPNQSKVINIDSKGKLLWIQTENYYVHLHMMITGWLVFEKPKISKYDLIFDNITIYIDDVRRFSTINILSEEEHEKEINDMGYSFLHDEISKELFIETLSLSKKNICALLLDQSVFCGVGNYIKNEALYIAKINPHSKACDINIENVEQLYNAIRFVMFSNLYELLENDKLKISKKLRKISPKKLEIPYIFRVYDKEKDDNNNKITKEKISGRWTFYVKQIQK